jgi:hypothetical protein
MREAGAQANLQAWFFLAVFQRRSREWAMEHVEWLLPDRIPWLWDRMGYTRTPAQLLHDKLISAMGRFQEGVVERAAASQLDKRYNPRGTTGPPSFKGFC